jgi:hypothetical protein
MWGYFALTFFFCLIILFLGDVLDIILKNEFWYFKIKILSKFQSIFMFYSRRNRKMSNIAFYLEVIGYFLFITMSISNLIFTFSGYSENYYFNIELNQIYIYLFDLILIYFLSNLIVYILGNKINRS